jgi:hypothetical protein
LLRRLLYELDETTNERAAFGDLDSLQCGKHDGKHRDEIVHQYDELLVARGYSLEVLNINVSHQTTDMIGVPYRDDLIDNTNSYASDGVKLFDYDEHAVNELQILNPRT